MSQQRTGLSLISIGLSTGKPMSDITCPSCNTEFEADPWDSGCCPKCGKAYYWFEECTEDYSDCWSVVEWE